MRVHSHANGLRVSGSLGGKVVSARINGRNIRGELARNPGEQVPEAEGTTSIRTSLS